MKKITHLGGPYVFGPNSQPSLVGRAYYNVYYDDGSKTTILRSRHLMQEHLGRELRTDEHVDHINDDKTDDRLENLQVLSVSDHARKTFKERSTEYIAIICLLCGKSSEKKARHVRHNKKQGKTGPFCNNSCAAKYQHKNKAS